MIEIDGTDITIDAALLADALGVDAEGVGSRLRKKAITTLVEKGTGEDDGLYRLTFYRKTRRLRLVVRRDGTILERTVTSTATGTPTPIQVRGTR